MTTAVEACKLGFAGFIAPFAFCYNNGLLLEGGIVNILSVCITAFIGTVVISMGFQGWMLWKLHPIERLLLVVGGVLMFKPGSITDAIGLAIIVVLLLINRKKWFKKKTVKTASNS